MISEKFANSFRSDLLLEQVLERLNDVGPWKWIERDNDDWGPYIYAVFNRDADRAILKILQAEGGYVINVFYRSSEPGAQAEFETMRETLFQHLLPAIGARELAVTEIYER